MIITSPLTLFTSRTFNLIFSLIHVTTNNNYIKGARDKSSTNSWSYSPHGKQVKPATVAAITELFQSTHTGESFDGQCTDIVCIKCEI